MRLLIIIFLIVSCVAGQDMPITEGPDPAPPGIDIIESPPIVDLLGPGQPIPIFQELPKAADVVGQIVTEIFCPQCAAEEAAIRAKNRAFLGNDTGNISANFTA